MDLEDFKKQLENNSEVVYPESDYDKRQCAAAKATDERSVLPIHSVIAFNKTQMESTKLDCSKGWVKIERLIDDEEKESVKLTTNMDDEGELALTLSYDCEDKANTSFNNLSKTKPDELQAAILQVLGL